MRFSAVGISLVGLVSLTSAARQCQPRNGVIKPTSIPLYSTDDAVKSSTDLSINTVTETNIGSVGTLTETSTTKPDDAGTSTVPSPAVSTEITTAAQTNTGFFGSLSETSTTKPDGASTSTLQSAAVSSETWTTQSVDTTTVLVSSSTVEPVEATSEAPAIQSTTETTIEPSIPTQDIPASSSDPTSSTEAASTTSTANPGLATFSLEVGNTLNTQIEGKGYYGYRDREPLLINPRPSDLALYSLGAFNLEPITNHLRINDLYVGYYEGASFYSFNDEVSMASWGFTPIRCNDVHAGEALSCTVLNDELITKFATSGTATESIGVGMVNPNQLGAGLVTIDLIAR